MMDQSNKERLTNTILLIPSTKIPVDKIILDPSNPNKMTDQQILGLEKFMKKHGFAVELWVNHNKDNTYLCIDGEHRVKVLQKNNIKSVYAKIFHVKPHEVKMMRQIANKLHGIHDKKMDALEYKEIFDAGELDELADILDESVEDFENILEKNFDISFEREETNDTPLPPAEPKSKLGDVYQLGSHRIMCGDSLAEENVTKLFQQKKPSLLFSDPPYNIGYDYSHYIDKKDDDEYYNFCKTFFNLSKSIITGNRIILTPGHQNIELWCNIEKPTHIAPWIKRNSTSGCKISMFSVWEPIFFYGEFKQFRKRSNDIFEINNKIQVDIGIHKCPKQVDLLIELFENYSKREEIIYDCFLGSGSTLIACESTDRICFGMEIDPGYIDVIITRFINYVGNDKDVYLIKNDKKIPYSKISRKPTMKKLE